MDDTQPDTPQQAFPFNNRYLISGLIHGANKGWMYLVTILLLLFGYTFFQLLVSVPLLKILIENGYSEREIMKNASLLFDSNALKLDRNLVLLPEMGMFVFAFIGFYIGIRFIHRKTLTSILTGFAAFRYSRFWFAFAVWTFFLIASVLVNYIFFPGELVFNFNLPGFLISALILLLLMPIQTGLEEMVFRGYFIQGLSQLTFQIRPTLFTRFILRKINPALLSRYLAALEKNNRALRKASEKIFRNGILPLLITSLLFGLAHMANPEVRQFGWPVMLTYYTFFALFMGCLALLDEGLELAFGIHFANNIISSMLLCSSSSVIKTYALFDVKKEDSSSEIVAWMIMASLAFLIFWLKYRWKNFKLIIK